MSRPALFVDLTNFYSRLIKSGLAEPAVLRDYFTNWFDFDTFARHIAGQTTDVWVFYSGGKVGSAEARIDKKRLEDYIHRINHLEGVTARDVNIPGEQREHLTGTCEHCGKEVSMEWRSEKGIDSSLTVHLFDTMEVWDTAYLLSGDADFVPVVASLRRRGKIVVGVGFPDASTALIRECFNYINVSEAYLKADIETYKLLGKDGIALSWFTDIKPLSIEQPTILELSAGWKADSEYSPDHVTFMLTAVGSYDLSGFRQKIQTLKLARRVSQRPHNRYKRVFFHISRSCMESVARHSALGSYSIAKLAIDKTRIQTVYKAFRFSQEENCFEAVDPNTLQGLSEYQAPEGLESEYFDEGLFLDMDEDD